MGGTGDEGAGDWSPVPSSARDYSRLRSGMASKGAAPGCTTVDGQWGSISGAGGDGDRNAVACAGHVAAADHGGRPLQSGAYGLDELVVTCGMASPPLIGSRASSYTTSMRSQGTRSAAHGDTFDIGAADDNDNDDDGGGSFTEEVSTFGPSCLRGLRPRSRTVSGDAKVLDEERIVAIGKQEAREACELQGVVLRAVNPGSIMERLADLTGGGGGGGGGLDTTMVGCDPSERRRSNSHKSESQQVHHVPTPWTGFPIAMTVLSPVTLGGRSYYTRDLSVFGGVSGGAFPFLADDELGLLNHRDVGFYSGDACQVCSKKLSGVQRLAEVTGRRGYHSVWTSATASAVASTADGTVTTVGSAGISATRADGQQLFADSRTSRGPLSRWWRKYRGPPAATQCGYCGLIVCVSCVKKAELAPIPSELLKFTTWSTLAMGQRGRLAKAAQLERVEAAVGFAQRPVCERCAAHLKQHWNVPCVMLHRVVNMSHCGFYKNGVDDDGVKALYFPGVGGYLARAGSTVAQLAGLRWHERCVSGPGDYEAMARIRDSDTWDRYALLQPTASPFMYSGNARTRLELLLIRVRMRAIMILILSHCPAALALASSFHPTVRPFVCAAGVPMISPHVLCSLSVFRIIMLRDLNVLLRHIHACPVCSQFQRT